MTITALAARILGFARYLWSRFVPLPSAAEPLKVTADLCCRQHLGATVSEKVGVAPGCQGTELARPGLKSSLTWRICLACWTSLDIAGLPVRRRDRD
jgi:hypothetical protein